MRLHILPTVMNITDLRKSRCYGAASAKDRLDCVIRDAINQGSIPGPRYLANGKEIARRGGELTPGITAFADGMTQKSHPHGLYIIVTHSLRQKALLKCVRLSDTMPILVWIR